MDLAATLLDERNGHSVHVTLHPPAGTLRDAIQTRWFSKAVDLPRLATLYSSALASVLLHCRRPFDLLESVARRTERTMIITEIWNPTLGEGPVCMLLPHQGMKQVHTWWHFTPQFFISALGILGFTEARVSLHTQRQPAENREVTLFTVVCERPESQATSTYRPR